MLINTSNETTTDRAAAIGVTTWLTYNNPLVILPHPTVSCTSQIDKLNGNVVGITTPASFKYSMMALISAVLPGMLLLVYYFPR